MTSLSSEKLVVNIWTDGACSGNPGKGGWGAVLRYGEHEKQISGAAAYTTNNQMELMGAISALESLKKSCHIHLYTDSVYVKNGITEWIHGWKKKGWKTASGSPVKNEDLWKRLEAACKIHKIEWHWIKGHAGHPENELADSLARNAIKTL